MGDLRSADQGKRCCQTWSPIIDLEGANDESGLGAKPHRTSLEDTKAHVLLEVLPHRPGYDKILIAALKLRVLSSSQRHHKERLKWIKSLLKHNFDIYVPQVAVKRPTDR